MRKCKFNFPEYKRVYEEKEMSGVVRKVYSHTETIDHWQEGFFHQWGIDYEEFETGPGNFTVGIVETSDGKIHTPVPSNIQFLE
jgi:hypothetical protein